MSKFIEVELKFILKDEEGFTRELSTLAKKVRETLQKDSYYVPSHRDFLKTSPVNERLRLRESSKGCSINYKNWHTKGGIQLKHCDEYESEVENIEAVKKIFEAIDIKKLVVVDKRRTTWIYKEVEIVVDEVKELGYFVEFELKGAYSSLDAATKYLYEIAEEFKSFLGEEDKVGYPYLLLEKRGYQFKF